MLARANLRSNWLDFQPNEPNVLVSAIISLRPNWASNYVRFSVVLAFRLVGFSHGRLAAMLGLRHVSALSARFSLGF